MGRLYYGNTTDGIEIPDRELAHLRVLATTKLRRSESFSVSWTRADCPEGRSTIWVHASIPLRFELDRAEETLDRRYLEELANAANTSGGVMLDIAAPETVSRPVAVAAADLRRAA